MEGSFFSFLVSALVVSYMVIFGDQYKGVEISIIRSQKYFNIEYYVIIY